MPYAAPRPCTHPGCNALTIKGSRCAAHPYKIQRTAKAKEYNKLYNTARWRRRSKAHKRAHPLCVKCEAKGIVKQVEVTDHITPHKGDTGLFFNERNWQSLCKRCHDTKTATEDGGFSNVKK